MIELFRADPETRQGYVALWDTAGDLGGSTGASPCLVTLFFRRSAEGEFRIDTSELTPDQLLQQFLSASLPHLSVRDTLTRMLTR